MPGIMTGGAAGNPDAGGGAATSVVVNDEEQYSIWPADRALPPGWRREGFTGSEDECLAHIDEVWTDLRPLSLRQWLQDRAGHTGG